MDKIEKPMFTYIFKVGVKTVTINCLLNTKFMVPAKASCFRIEKNGYESPCTIFYNGKGELASSYVVPPPKYWSSVPIKRGPNRMTRMDSQSRYFMPVLEVYETSIMAQTEGLKKYSAVTRRYRRDAFATFDNYMELVRARVRRDTLRSKGKIAKKIKTKSFKQFLELYSKYYL